MGESSIKEDMARNAMDEKCSIKEEMDRNAMDEESIKEEASEGSTEDQTEADADKDSDNAQKRRYSADLGDYSTFGCHECDFMGHYRKFVKHLRKKHGLTLKAYKAIHDEVKFIEKVLHICKICKQEI